MAWGDIRREVNRAKAVLQEVDSDAEDMAALLVGNLRGVNREGNYSQTEILRKLKKELRSFNSVTGQWKNE